MVTGEEGNFIENAAVVAGSVTTVLLGVYTFVLKHKVRVAEASTSVATSVADRAVADAQAVAYNTVTQRMQQFEQDVATLRRELETERKYNRKLDLHNRKLEIYIIRLVAMLKAAGIEVPNMDTLPEAVEDRSNDN